MKKIFALVEHRKGEIRDISYELLTKGRKLGELSAIILGYNISQLVEKIRKEAHRIIVIDNKICENFNAETYQIILSSILQKEKPYLTLIGHTATGMDLAPSLATQLNIPLVTDCIEINIEPKLFVTRQMFGGKINADVSCVENEQYIITVRQGSFPYEEGNLSAKVITMESPITQEPDYRKFMGFVEAEVGAVDITKADIVVGIGRGIKEKDNIPMIEEFANSIGGVLGCSRPIIDAGWLPKDRQVGSSGKTIKPKLYIAIGISGAFQHIMGIKGANIIFAINKDPNAPIFNEAHYGIVGDLFKVVPAIKEKIKELVKP